MDKKPKLIFIMGVPGSGKSTLAKKLVRHFSFPLLDNDTIASSYLNELNTLVGLKKEDRDSKPYQEKVKHLEYVALEKLIAENLSLGVSVIVPITMSTLSKKEDYLKRFLEKHHLSFVDVVLIELITPSKEVLYNRINARGYERDFLKLSNWEQYYKEIKDYSVKWVETEKLLVSSTEENLKKVISFIEKR